MEDYTTMNKVHTLLIKYFGGTYQIDRIFANLSTKCTELLLRCEWKGKDVDCEKIFSLQTAWLGMCCLFNSRRLIVTGNKVIDSYKPLYVDAPGVGNGLSVVVNDSFDKFSFKTYSSVSTKIAVFEPEVYPEVASIGFGETHAITGHEIQIAIYPTIITGMQSMRRFAPSVRRCFFRDETQFSREKYYTMSECVIRCRIQDVIEFCGCIPPRFTNRQNETYCLLNDISCLSRWNERWIAWEPLNLVDNNAGRFARCPHCLPRCNYVNYKLTASYSTLRRPPNKKNGYSYGIVKNLSSSDITIIHFYFAENFVNTMTQTVLYDWTEVLALLGGICGLMYGASLLSVIELIYFATGKFFNLWRGPFEVTRSEGSFPTDPKGNQPQLYWEEMYVPKKKELIHQ